MWRSEYVLCIAHSEFLSKCLLSYRHILPRMQQWRHNSETTFHPCYRSMCLIQYLHINYPNGVSYHTLLSGKIIFLYLSEYFIKFFTQQGLLCIHKTLRYAVLFNFWWLLFSWCGNIVMLQVYNLWYVKSNTVMSQNSTYIRPDSKEVADLLPEDTYLYNKIRCTGFLLKKEAKVPNYEFLTRQRPCSHFWEYVCSKSLMSMAYIKLIYIY